MGDDILTAVTLGVLLSFTIGPVFFVLLETAALKGFRAAFAFDIGVILGDSLFILIAYYSTNRILERLKDDPGLFIFGGILMILYGSISWIKSKATYRRELVKDFEDIPFRSNYATLVLKGFLLNFINIGVLGFWLGIIIIFAPQLEMSTQRVSVFMGTILLTYLCVDCGKIVLAKQLKSSLTAFRIYRIKQVISLVLIIFGVGLMLQGLFPEEKSRLNKVIEQIKS